MTRNKTAGFASAFASFLFLAACAAPTQTTLPDGTVALLIDCEGTAAGMNYCFERAGKSCGADGYTIVDPTGERLSGSDVADEDIAGLVRQFQTDQSSILVRCGT